MSNSVFSATGNRILRDKAVMDLLSSGCVLGTGAINEMLGIATEGGWSDAEAAAYNTLVRLQDAGRITKSYSTDGEPFWHVVEPEEIPVSEPEEEAVDDDTLRYETGAARSRTGEDVRFDLVSPIAIIRVAGTVAYRTAQADDLDATDCPRELAGDACEYLWLALGLGVDVDAVSDDVYDLLGYAALCILKACHIARGGDPGYVDFRRPRCESEHFNVRVDLLPPLGLFGVAETYREGAEKRGVRNWESGMPAHSCVNRALRHLVKYLADDDTEPHLEHATWNVFAAIHMLATRPDLNRGHFRKPGEIPDFPDRYFPEVPAGNSDDEEWADDDVVGLTDLGICSGDTEGEWEDAGIYKDVAGESASVGDLAFQDDLNRNWHVYDCDAEDRDDDDFEVVTPLKNGDAVEIDRKSMQIRKKVSGGNKG